MSDLTRAAYNRSFANCTLINCEAYGLELEHQDIFNRCEMVELDDSNTPTCGLDIVDSDRPFWDDSL